MDAKVPAQSCCDCCACVVPLRPSALLCSGNPDCAPAASDNPVAASILKTRQYGRLSRTHSRFALVLVRYIKFPEGSLTMTRQLVRCKANKSRNCVDFGFALAEQKPEPARDLNKAASQQRPSQQSGQSPTSTIQYLTPRYCCRAPAHYACGRRGARPEEAFAVFRRRSVAYFTTDNGQLPYTPLAHDTTNFQDRPTLTRSCFDLNDGRCYSTCCWSTARPAKHSAEIQRRAARCIVQ